MSLSAPSVSARLETLRAQLAVLEAGRRASDEVLPFGDPRIDQILPGGGLRLGCWHEAAGEGLDLETAAAAAAFVAALGAPLAERGAVVWVMRRDDLFAPGLTGLGFPAERLIQVAVRDDAEVLAALEDALAAPGVAAAVGEVEAVGLTAGRRLQLACEAHGGTGFIVRRRPFGGAARAGASGSGGAGSAASTRWRITPAPSVPAPGEPGLGPARWAVRLERARGGRTGAWLMEKSDGAFPLRVVAELGDRPLAAAEPLSLAG
jgi:protein ImuA